MSAVQVANSMATAMDAAFTAIDNANPTKLRTFIDDPTIFTSSNVVYGASPTGQSVPTATLRVYGHNVLGTSSRRFRRRPAAMTAFPLPFSSSLEGDQFGLFSSPLTTTIKPIGDGLGDTFFETIITFNNNNAVQRGQDNAHQGVFIDNIVVGFAGRGEMVTGLNNPRSDSTTSADPTIGVSTFTQLPADPDPADTKRITAGVFQLDIRAATAVRDGRRCLPGHSIGQFVRHQRPAEPELHAGYPARLATGRRADSTDRDRDRRVYVRVWLSALSGRTIGPSAPATFRYSFTPATVPLRSLRSWPRRSTTSPCRRTSTSRPTSCRPALELTCTAPRSMSGLVLCNC